MLPPPQTTTTTTAVVHPAPAPIQPLQPAVVQPSPELTFTPTAVQPAAQSQPRGPAVFSAVRRNAAARPGPREYEEQQTVAIATEGVNGAAAPTQPAAQGMSITAVAIVGSSPPAAAGQSGRQMSTSASAMVERSNQRDAVNNQQQQQQQQQRSGNEDGATIEFFE